MKVHFVYSKDTENSGDLSCGYYAYFGEMFKKYPIVIWDIGTIDFSLVAKNDVVIVGGGGLLDNSDLWNYNINRLAQKCRYCFLFAPGFNRHYGHRVSVMLKTGAFRQWAVRDYHHPAGGRYVPCASCLRPEFSMTYPVVRKYGVVKHFQFDMSREFNLPQITNDRPLHELLAFIGSSEIIVSNTYHAVYWATLLKKKVILDAPFSEKFKYLKYPPVLFRAIWKKMPLKPWFMKMRWQKPKNWSEILPKTSCGTARQMLPAVFGEKPSKYCVCWFRSRSGASCCACGFIEKLAVFEKSI